MAPLAERPRAVDSPICDSHHHLHRRADGRRSAAYLPQDLLKTVHGGHNVGSVVHVESGCSYRSDCPEWLAPVGETEWLIDLLRASPRLPIAGIVGFVDLRHHRAGEALEAHLAAAADRFRGVRHTAAWDACPSIRRSPTAQHAHTVAEPAFSDGVSLLERHGLVFETWVYFHQLPDVAVIARRHPGVVVVIDHLGGPIDIGPYRRCRDDVLTTWRTHMAVLANLPNVRVKLSGIGMRRLTDPDRLPTLSSASLARHWRACIRWCIDAFGPARCMFASNYPTDAELLDYSVIWNTFQRITDDLSPSERRLLFHDTAVRTYGLAAPSPRDGAST